jgi:uptake hydrogenase large subunit
VSIEGSLRIELLCRDNRIRRVRILSSRPLQLPLLFEGKPVEEVLQTIPMLYSICATAQANAAVTACRQALGADVDSHVLLAEAMLVWFETAREHLWRVLIDWPGYLGEAVERQELPGLSLLIPDAKKALFDSQTPAFTLQPGLQPKAEEIARLIEGFSQTLQRSVFAMPVADWHAMDTLQGVERWIDAKQTAAARYLHKLKDAGVAKLGQSGIEALPDIDNTLLHQRLQESDAESFIAAPEWQSRPRESSCLTRQAAHPLIQAMAPVYGQGMLSRLVARLVELASIPTRLATLIEMINTDERTMVSTLPTSPKGMGLGVVEAARGRLIHRASVSGDKVERYQILAPTEWNFHPQGLVAEGLLGLSCGYEANLREQASLFISAVDPCVGYSFEFV